MYYRAFVAAAVLSAAHGGSLAATACAEVPYSVKLKETAGKLSVTVPAPLISIKPIGAGFNYSRSMYAAMGPSVVREMLNSYDCRVREAIEADAKPEADKIQLRNAWESVVADLQASATVYFMSYLDSIAAGNAENPNQKPQALEPEQKGLAPYLKYIPVENFTLEDSLQAYIEANIAGLGVNACGMYARAALAQNAPAIQHLAGAIRPALEKYLSPQAQFGPRNAKLDLWTEAGSFHMILPPTGKDIAKAAQDCIK